MSKTYKSTINIYQKEEQSLELNLHGNMAAPDVRYPVTTRARDSRRADSYYDGKKLILDGSSTRD
jgi:hypothetical protein